jgi:LuxR family maltose regulon positive regulatory protein
LARLRARGQLLELRTADLRFTPEETAAFLQRTMGLPLSSEQVAQLEMHTEGWIAGLQLAALSMKGQSDFAGFINSFTGSNRFVLDYLVDEVLQRQPEHVQTYLLHTAILDRLHPALCDALTGRQDSRALLVQLERENLFLTPLDEARTWWRYHHLFAEVLRSRLLEAQPNLVPALHCRAAGWYAQNGLLTEAIQHALTAADFGLAADLIEQSADALLMRGEHNTLQCWLARLPCAVLDAHPQLLLVHAAVCLLLHQLDRAERDLDAAERSVQRVEPALRQRILGEAAALRANIATFQENLPRAIALAQQALAELPPEDLRRRGEVMVRLGIAYAWSGAALAAGEAHAEAVRLSTAAGDTNTTLQAMVNLAAAQAMRGRLREAVAINRQALQLAVEQGVAQFPITGFIHCELAIMLYEWNELEQAIAHLQAAIELSERGGRPRVLADCYNWLALVLQAQGDRDGAQAALDKSEQLIHLYSLPVRFSASANLAKVALWLAQGEVTIAAAWAQTSGISVLDEPAFMREDEYLAFIRIQIAQAQYRPALDFLSRLAPPTRADGRFYGLTKILALEAKAAYLMGDKLHALSALQPALALAAPEGYIRTFVDEGEAMHEVIAECATRSAEWRRHPYLENLLAAFTTPDRALKSGSNRLPALLTPVDLLSIRELEVLRLLAAGASNHEIGERLVVTLNTVKRHIRNIFNKLAANNRTQAVARGRELGLI